MTLTVALGLGLWSLPVVAQQRSASKRTKGAAATAPATESETAEDKQAQLVQKFETAQELHAAGKLAEALKLYDEALQLDDSQSVIHYQRGSALVGLNRLDDAVSALTRAVTLQSDFARGYALLGEAEARRNHTIEAEKAFLRAVELDGTLMHARLGAAQLMATRKAAKEALPLLEPLAKQPNGERDAAFYVVYGEVLRETGNLPGALQAYTDGLLREPRNPLLLRGRAYTYLALKNPVQGMNDFQTAYRFDPDPETAADIVYASLAAGKSAETLDFAAEAVRKTPNSIRLQAGYGALLSETGQTAEAAQVYMELTKLEPRQANWWIRLGDALQTSDPEQATAAYEKALALNPRLADAQAGVAAGLLRSQKFEEAATKFQEILTSDANNYAAHAGLATALFKLDRFQPAAKEFIWMLERKPNVPVTYFFLGVCFDKMGDFPQALKAYEMFVQRADAKQNQLEIDKVNLRLPSLKRQIEKKK